MLKKKPILWRRVMLLVFMLPLIFCVPLRPVYAGTSLIIHYQREDGDYAKWNIWSWAEGKDGAAYPFNGEDAFGVYAEITLPQDTTSAGFIVRTDSWEKDVEADRFIDLSQGNEIWVYSATPEFLYEAPEGYATEATPIPALRFTVHYNRYDGHYDELAVSAFVSGAEESHAPRETRRDDFGAVYDFHFTNLTSQDKIKIEMRQADGGVDEFTVSLRQVETENLEVYCVNGTRAQSFDKPASDLTLTAALDAPDLINITLSYPVAVAEDLPTAFTVLDTDGGSPVPVASVKAVNDGGNDAAFGRLTPGYATQFALTFDMDLPLDHTYTVSGYRIDDTAVVMGKVSASDRFAEMFTYEGSDLGATYSAEATAFRLWAPFASSVDLLLKQPYSQGETVESSASSVTPMKKDVNGTWIVTAPGDLDRYHYRYGVTNNGTYAELVDPYAIAAGVNGDWGVVFNLSLSNPAGWEEDRRPALQNPTDAVIYELHVRDFSTHNASGMVNKGKFLAFTEWDTATPDGQKTGVAHMKELGITHVHLLPVFDYASLDESKPNANGFNWGYDPLNYNVPEGTYSTDAFEPYSRIYEFKEMVKSLHEDGIGVIMDVVYNHTGPTADSNLSLAVPGYYYRMNANGTFSNGSGCGNETASERSMVRKLIVDSVVHWATEYHIDGFRFDLMGLHDVDTMNAIRQALDEIDPSILMYGEGWTGGTSPLPSSKAALKANMVMLDERIAAFSDDIRDGIKGSVFNANDPGYVSGYYGRKEQIKFGVVGSVPHPQIDVSRLTNSQQAWAKSPTQTITYASAHDNLTLWDKLLASTPNATEEEHLAMNRMSAAIVFTSQGIPFIQAGEEIARSKNGDENSYKSPDSVNQIRWDTKTERLDLFRYYQGLIALRKAHPAFRMTDTADVQANILFMDTEAQTLAYTLNNNANGDSAETILVAFNADKVARTLTLPTEGVWSMLVDGTRAGTEVLDQFDTQNGDFTLQPRSSYVFVYAGISPERQTDAPAAEVAPKEDNQAPVDTVEATKTSRLPSRLITFIAIPTVGVLAVLTGFILYKKRRK